MILRIFIIIIFAVLCGIANNVVNPHAVPWTGNWPDLGGADNDSIWTSPSYVQGDAPQLRVAEAFDRFAAKTHVFLDAREPDEYQLGHIQGAINLPFETFDSHWSQVEPRLPKDALIVTYCSGTECEASLELARLLIQGHGYRTVEIFFGGWQAWSKHKLPIEGSYDGESANQ